MELISYLNNIFKEKPLKVILSNAKNSDYRKITLSLKNDEYFVEKLTDKQAFHEHVKLDKVSKFCSDFLTNGFKQLNAFTNDNEYSIKVSKKDKIFFNSVCNKCNIKHEETHNHQKEYILKEGVQIEPLIDMGVFTKNYKIVSSMQDKYRQINKFLVFIDEVIDKLNVNHLNIIDFGCGKSYLTFVVYYYLVNVKHMTCNIVGLDLKEEVIKNCNKAAIKYGYDNLHFEVGNINGYKAPFDVDLVITLHACDMATDFALYNAIKWNTKAIISVPCCQHELNSQFKANNLEIVGRYGIIKERASALFTDAIRGNLLQVLGYKTQLLEFVDLSHTPKNILIRAYKSNISKEHKEKCLNEVNELIKTFNFDQCLYRLLKQDGLIREE